MEILYIHSSLQRNTSVLCSHRTEEKRQCPTQNLYLSRWGVILLIPEMDDGWRLYQDKAGMGGCRSMWFFNNCLTRVKTCVRNAGSYGYQETEALGFVCVDEALHAALQYAGLHHREGVYYWTCAGSLKNILTYILICHSLCCHSWLRRLTAVVFWSATQGYASNNKGSLWQQLHAMP